MSNRLGGECNAEDQAQAGKGNGMGRSFSRYVTIPLALSEVFWGGCQLAVQGPKQASKSTISTSLFSKFWAEKRVSITTTRAAHF